MIKLIISFVVFIAMCFYFNDGRSQQVRTFAGNGLDSLLNGKGTHASFGKSFGIGSDKNGNLYVPDTYNNCIRIIDPEGNVSTYAGTGVAGNKDGDSKVATFYEPAGAYVDNDGNVFIADWGGQ